mgnify:FL=1
MNTPQLNEEQLKRDSIDQLLRDGAELVIVKPDYAYLSIGSSRYYFHREPVKDKVKLFNGEEVERTTIQYDGWERGV